MSLNIDGLLGTIGAAIGTKLVGLVGGVAGGLGGAIARGVVVEMYEYAKVGADTGTTIVTELGALLKSKEVIVVAGVIGAVAGIKVADNKGILGNFLKVGESAGIAVGSKVTTVLGVAGKGIGGMLLIGTAIALGTVIAVVGAVVAVGVIGGEEVIGGEVIIAIGGIAVVEIMLVSLVLLVRSIGMIEDSMKIGELAGIAIGMIEDSMKIGELAGIAIGLTVEIGLCALGKGIVGMLGIAVVGGISVVVLELGAPILGGFLIGTVGGIVGIVRVIVGIPASITETMKMANAPIISHDTVINYSEFYLVFNGGSIIGLDKWSINTIINTDSNSVEEKEYYLWEHESNFIKHKSSGLYLTIKDNQLVLLSKSEFPSALLLKYTMKDCFMHIDAILNKDKELVNIEHILTAEQKDALLYIKWAMQFNLSNTNKDAQSFAEGNLILSVTPYQILSLVNKNILSTSDSQYNQDPLLLGLALVKDTNSYLQVNYFMHNYVDIAFSKNEQKSNDKFSKKYCDYIKIFTVQNTYDNAYGSKEYKEYIRKILEYSTQLEEKLEARAELLINKIPSSLAIFTKHPLVSLFYTDPYEKKLKELSQDIANLEQQIKVQELEIADIHFKLGIPKEYNSILEAGRRCSNAFIEKAANNYNMHVAGSYDMEFVPKIKYQDSELIQHLLARLDKQVEENNSPTSTDCSSKAHARTITLKSIQEVMNLHKVYNAIQNSTVLGCVYYQDLFSSKIDYPWFDPEMYKLKDSSVHYKVDVDDKNLRKGEICNVPSSIIFGYKPCLDIDKEKLLEFGIELKDYSCDKFDNGYQIVGYEYNDYCGNVIVQHDEL